MGGQAEASHIQIANFWFEHSTQLLAVFLWATPEVSLFKCEPYRLHLPYFKPLPRNLSP